MYFFIHFYLALWQAAETGGADYYFKTYWWAIILLFLSNAATYYFNRPKTDSEIQKNSADAIKSIISSLAEVQAINKTLFEGLKTSRHDAFQLEEEVQKTRDELRDCLDKGEDCKQCRAALIHAAETLKQAQKFIAVNADTQPLLEKISEIIKKVK